MRNPFLALLLLPAMEIGLLALFASHYGLTGVALEVFGTSLLGLYLVRRAGYRTLVEANVRMQRGEEAPDAVLGDLLRAIAGLMLVIPGLATDFVGLMLCLPVTRRRLSRSWVASGKVFSYNSARQTYAEPGANRPGSTDAPLRRPQRDNGGEVIEGEFSRED